MTTYAESGVDREARKTAKRMLEGLQKTWLLSRHGPMIATPYNTLYPVGNGTFHTKCCDGVGTKVMLAQTANKHDTIGIDAIAMVTNDAIRCGAEPLAVTDVIDIRKSEPGLLGQLQAGLHKGAELSGCPLVSGETADVPEIMAVPYHINCDCVGEVRGENVITGKGLAAGDIIVGLPSSGLHSNGLSLARRALFKQWGGAFEPWDRPDGLDREIIIEALEPTRIYVKQFLELARKVKVKAAVHITGDAYGKFDRLFSASPGIGLEFDNFRPQPIFRLIRENGVLPAEMFNTFNMGWGFAVIVNKEDVETALQLLGDGEAIGKITPEAGRIRVKEGGTWLSIR